MSDSIHTSIDEAVRNLLDADDNGDQVMNAIDAIDLALDEVSEEKLNAVAIMMHAAAMNRLAMVIQRLPDNHWISHQICMGIRKGSDELCSAFGSVGAESGIAGGLAQVAEAIDNHG